MRKIRILSLLMVLCMVVTILASCGDKPTPPPDPGTEDTVKVGGSIIIGNSTELSGSDFVSTAWGNNAADKDIRTLTNGYSCVQQNKNGEYVWDTKVVVKNKEIIDNADGSKTFKITINDNLKYSDGTPITAKDYVAYSLLMASPVCLGAGVTAVSGTSYVGNEAFNVATSPTPFTGIRLYDEYTFSYQMKAEFFPYYYENTYAAFSPYPLKLWLGADVDVRDDGQGAYLTEKWYEKTTDANGTETYVKAAQIEKARYDTTPERPCSGPYRFVEFNKGEKTAKLTINTQYLGNFEGQKPHIKDITYRLVVTKTQMDLLKSGGVDIISGVSGGDEINSGLAAAMLSDGKLTYTNYLRAGYGKLQLVNDYGPTQFKNVRHALSHLLDKTAFASTYTKGYGSLVKGPYGLASWMYQETKDDLEPKLKAYAFSVDQAMELLKEDGWVYAADGSAYTSGTRYKKLTAAEAAINGNATYKSGNYKTVKVGEDYYMPLALSWCSTTDNPVSELLVTMLKEAPTTAQAGMVINQDVVQFPVLLNALYRKDTFENNPQYSLFNLGTGFTPVYDYAGYWMTKYSLSNITFAGVTPCEGATYTEADAAKYSDAENATILAVWNMYMAQGNQGYFADKELDELSWNMVYKANTKEEFKQYWEQYIIRWNEVLPEITLYSDLYHDFYNSKIANYEVNPDWSAVDAILYCYDKTAQ